MKLITFLLITLFSATAWAGGSLTLKQLVDPLHAGRTSSVVDFKADILPAETHGRLYLDQEFQYDWNFGQNSNTAIATSLLGTRVFGPIHLLTGVKYDGYQGRKFGPVIGVKAEFEW